MNEKVSIVTPTHGRERFLRLTHAAVAAQTYSNLEWLVLDDSPAPSPYMQTVRDPRVQYRHSPERMTIGRKRNALAAASTGRIIVQFDDDDYYHPRYVERMIARLAGGYDFVKLSGWYLYSVAYRAAAYWDLNRKTGRHYVWDPPRPVETRRISAAASADLAHNHLGYGFSYVYRREVWEAQPFSDDANWGEDTPFALAAARSFRFAHFRDVRGICVHLLHGGNTSRCFPQYRVPTFALGWLFPAALEGYLAP